jgi:hypothetical protein
MLLGEMPVTYSYEEYTDLVFVYGFCNGNGRAAAEEYRRQYPHRMVPHHSTFVNVYGRRLVPALELIGNTLNGSMMMMFLMQYTEAQPQMCAEFRAQLVFPPLKYGDIKRVQHFLPRDYTPRMEFCERLQANLDLLIHGFIHP